MILHAQEGPELEIFYTQKARNAVVLHKNMPLKQRANIIFSKKKLRSKFAPHKPPSHRCLDKFV
jgi:hypothetical protein